MPVYVNVADVRDATLVPTGGMTPLAFVGIVLGVVAVVGLLVGTVVAVVNLG